MNQAANLRLFQFLFCGSLFAHYIDEFYKAHQKLSEQPGPLRGLGIVELLFPLGPNLLLFYWAAFLLCLLAAAGGFRPRLFLALSAFFFLPAMGSLFWSLDSHMTTIGRPQRRMNLVFPVLLLLAISPGPAIRMPLQSIFSKAREAASAWTLPLLKLTLAIFYFGNGYNKLMLGRSWLDGTTLQAFLLVNWMNKKSGLTLWVAEQDWLCSLLSVLTLLFELSAPLLVLFPAGEIVFVVTGIAFHLGVLILLGINFFIFPFIGVYLVFLRPEHLLAIWAKAPAWAQVRIPFLPKSQ